MLRTMAPKEDELCFLLKKKKKGMQFFAAETNLGDL